MNDRKLYLWCGEGERESLSDKGHSVGERMHD